MLQPARDLSGMEDEVLASGDDQPAYQISITDFNGGEHSRRTSVLDENELYFAIDWEASAAREYDPECMEAPQLHKSTEEARARSDAGPKPFTLQECLEVGCCLSLLQNISICPRVHFLTP